MKGFSPEGLRHRRDTITLVVLLNLLSGCRGDFTPVANFSSGEKTPIPSTAATAEVTATIAESTSTPTAFPFPTHTSVPTATRTEAPKPAPTKMPTKTPRLWPSIPPLASAEIVINWQSFEDDSGARGLEGKYVNVEALDGQIVRFWIDVSRDEIENPVPLEFPVDRERPLKIYDSLVQTGWRKFYGPNGEQWLTPVYISGAEAYSPEEVVEMVKHYFRSGDFASVDYFSRGVPARGPLQNRNVNELGYLVK